MFYTLFILLLVQCDINSPRGISKALGPAAQGMAEFIRNLCNLFYATTNNIQPLRDDFNIAQYSSLVDDNELAVKH